jgi:hypothetical protein
VDRMLAAMEHWRVPPFFQQFSGAGLITLVAAGITEAAARGVRFFVGVDPTLVVVGGIIMLVAGMAIVGAAQDAIDQFYVTASARLLDVVMRTAGIVVGIVASLELAWLLGTPFVAGRRNFPGDGQSKCGWVNSVARTRCRFGYRGWRNPRDVPWTADRGPASPHPYAPQPMATQRGPTSARKSATLGIASMRLHFAGLGRFRAQASRRSEIQRNWGRLRAHVPRWHTPSHQSQARQHEPIGQ